MVADPFFCLKIAHPCNSPTIYVKPALQIRRVLLRLCIGDSWHFAQWFGRSLSYRRRHIKKNPPKKCRLLHIALWRPRFANGRPNHCTKCHSRRIRCRVVTKSARSDLHIDGCVTLWTVALIRPIFKQKKGPATICLGLNYCSMDSSQITVNFA
jgi:hypothetical protein